MTPLAAGIILFLLCCFYTVLVEGSHRRWPSARHYTFFEVILGCAMVIGAASFAIGLEKAIVVAGYFCVGGLPMSVGAIIAHVITDSRAKAEQEAREHLRNGLAEE